MNTPVFSSEIVHPANHGVVQELVYRIGSKPARPRTKNCNFGSTQHWSQLMARAQVGDRRAYESLLREVMPYIRVIAGRWLQSPDCVENVVQDVLLAVHRARHAYDSARPFRPWLAAIIRCRSIDALRKHRRWTSVQNDASSIVCENFEDRAALRFEEAYAIADHLSKAIANLSAPQREAIEFIRLREMSLAEASKLTGRSIAALKVSVHRATKALQKQLQLC